MTGTPERSRFFGFIFFLYSTTSHHLPHRSSDYNIAVLTVTSRRLRDLRGGTHPKVPVIEELEHTLFLIYLSDKASYLGTIKVPNPVKGHLFSRALLSR